MKRWTLQKVESFCNLFFIPGDVGEPGNTGLTGYPGAKGERGLSGERGPPGPLNEVRGDKGDQGLIGLVGLPGPAGLPGRCRKIHCFNRNLSIFCLNRIARRAWAHWFEGRLWCSRPSWFTWNGWISRTKG